MTALDTEIFESIDSPRRSRLRTLLTQWPVALCAFISGMFMLATNDFNATNGWQEVSREHVLQMSINLESGREARQISFMLMGLWGALALALPGGRRFRPSPMFLFPLVVFIVWSYLSLLWSADRAFTMKRLIVFTFSALALFGFVKRFRLRDLALLALVGGLMQTSMNIVFDVLYSASARSSMAGYRFSGLQHPNHSGIAAVLLALAAIYFYDLTRLRRYLLILAVAVVVLLLTKSRSSLFAGIAGFLLFAALRWRGRTTALAAIGLGLGIGLTMMAAAAEVLPPGWTDVIHMGRQDAKTTALTGRPQIWDAALEVFGSDYARLLTGMGYDSFWRPETAEYVSGRVWFRISEGHNGYFDLLLELGVIGVACFAFLLFGCLVRWSMLAWRSERGSYAFCAAMLAFTVVHCLTESTMVDPNFSTFIMCGALAFLALRSPGDLGHAEVA